MTNAEKIRKSYTKEKTRRMLLALEKLLELYREKKEHTVNCPLCPVGYCEGCPWHLFMGRSCGNYRDRYFSEYHFVYLETDEMVKAWRKRRLRQLPRWIKYFEQALASWK
jgi:sulfatase maturation enzyme AslB (radical SAM superfamily)